MSDNSINFKEFSRKFKYVKDLGRGGGGHIILVYDEPMDIYFAIKKFEPHQGNASILSYDKFIDEIRILYKMHHPNIVRVYNYYEYKSSNVAYLQMEYVNGKPINECLSDTSLDWNRIFQETINAFKYLEEKGILHRDIRPANILIDNGGNVKIIDFGFGKEVVDGNDGTNKNSVFLNWLAPEPNEVKSKGKYCHATEIYYLGWLFKDIIENVEDFKYNDIIAKMTEYKEENRYKSFSEILLACFDIFTEKEKVIYQKFANKIDASLNYHLQPCVAYDIETIEYCLRNLLKNIVLEDEIKTNALVISCLVKNDFNYNNNIRIPIETVKDFYELIRQSSQNKKNIILNNLKIRLLNKKVKEEVEALPF